MSASLSPCQIDSDEAAVPGWLVLLLASACGVIAANIYYAQPLIAPISASLGISSEAAGLIVTMSQIGYGLGLLFVVPLADLFENRRLVLSLIALVTVALVVAAVATTAVVFLASALFIGISSVAVQVLVPYAAHLSPTAIRGRVVGNVMSGLMLGIMLARPVASIITHALSWHAVFLISAALMVALAIVLRAAMPTRQPARGLRYGALLLSMVQIVRDTPILRRRALYQACLFGVFSLFWTTVPLLLITAYHMSQVGIALFALAGVAGAVSAPIAGRLADRGLSQPATGFAMLAVAGAFLLSRLGTAGTTGSLAILVAAAILLDFGMTANMVLGQRAIFTLGAAHRGRLNGLYMATFFTGGAIGSALGGWGFAHGGWSLTSWIGFALPMAGLAGFATEFRRRPQAR